MKPVRCRKASVPPLHLLNPPSEFLACEVFDSQLRLIVSETDMEMIIQAFIASHLDCCNSFFTCFSKTSLDHLQAVQNVAAQALTRSSESPHVTPVLMSLHWLYIKFRIQFKIRVITQDLTANTSRSLRSSDRSRFKTKEN